MPPRVLTTLLVVAVLLAAPTPARAGSLFERPVPGEVTRAFDPPRTLWGPGHRGVDLAAPVGSVVRSAGAGTVRFAGTVAGTRWVTVAHRGALVTTYGPIAELAVAAGARVRAGQRLGTVAGGHDPARPVLHWSARLAGAYLDPLSLLDDARWVPTLIGPGGTEVTDLPDLPSYDPWQGRRGIAGWLGFVEGSPEAQHAGWSLAPNPNHVLGVAGLSSWSGRLPLDLTHLGFAPADVTYLSYAGREDVVGPLDPDDPHRDQVPYGPGDTWDGVHEAAEELREQLRAQWAREPGRAVDLVGHSMGGVVIAYYLLTMHDPADPTLPPIGHAVTVASPLEGSDLASAGVDAVRSHLVHALLRVSADRLDEPVPDVDDQAVQDLTVGSPIADRIAQAWDDARADVWSSPLATGTQVLTLGGSQDVVVPERRSDLPGAPHVVLPGGHDAVRLTEASRQVVRAFLADDPLPGHDGGAGHWLSYPVGWTERALGSALGALPWRIP